MAHDGDAAGYFFALLTVIGALPSIFLIFRYYRLSYATAEKEKRIDIQFEKSAMNYMIEYRQDLLQKNLESQRNSFRHQSKQFLKDNVKLGITASLLSADQPSAADSDHFQHLLRQQQTFWGIEDLILKEGELKYGETVLFQFPKGIFEDFLFYIFNKVNPLPFLFASEKHPQPMLSRFVSYTTAQTFVLLLYFMIRDSTMRTILGYLFSPLTLFVEYWLNLMLVCPCLPEETNQQSNQEDDPNPDENKGQSKSSRHAHKAIYHTIRAFGWFLAFPFLFFLIIILVAIALLLADHSVEHHLLGMFVADGIIYPFLLNIALASVNYFWFIHPTHLVVCGFRILTINSWTESQTNEYLLHHSSILTDEELNEEENARKKASYSEIDLCHCTCHCLQCTGYHRDSHYSLNICQPSCYISRCCDGLSAWYWEEEEAMKSLLPTPARHSMTSISQPSTAPPLSIPSPPEIESAIREDDL
jgi:hypothetical protein